MNNYFEFSLRGRTFLRGGRGFGVVFVHAVIRGGRRQGGSSVVDDPIDSVEGEEAGRVENTEAAV